MRPKIICVLAGEAVAPGFRVIPRLLNQVSCAERADMRGCELEKKRSRLHDRDEDVSRRLVLGTLLGLPAPRFLGEGRAWDQRAFLVRAVAPRASNAAASPSSVVSVHLPPVALARLTRHHRIRPRVVDVFCLAVCALATATRTALGALTPLTLVRVVVRVVVVGTLLVSITSTRLERVVVAAPLLPRVRPARILRGAGGGRLAPAAAAARVERTRVPRAGWRPLRARSRKRGVRVHGARRLRHRKVVVMPRRHRVGTRRRVVMRGPADDLRHLLAPRRRSRSRHLEPVAGSRPVGPP
mmetsp:Transcript_8750/g.35428  ORF Transcript_8750/g.35428 Transcript_8750/m.35428 type:complete len:298 (-) Transcript_8750:981-1874(-)